MRRLRRSIGIGVALSFLLLGAPTDGAGADTPVQDAPAPPAEQAPARRPAVEPTGRSASANAMRSGRLQCGDRITRSTTLTADVGPCAADGIIIGADNIMLNLNGHTISGTPGIGDGNVAGIRIPFKTGVRVTGLPGKSGKTGTVTGFDAGVFVNGGSGNTVENLVISDNVGPAGDALLSDGIVLFHSGNNRLLNNVVVRNGPFDGIGVLGSDSNDNLIQGNTVEETVGVPAQNTGGIITGAGAGEGTGILLNNFLDEQGTPRRGEPIRNNQVIDNIVRRNQNSGISNVTHVLGRIEGNIVEDNGAAGERCETVMDRFTGEQRTICGLLAAFPSNGIGVTKGPGSTGLAANGVTRMLITGNRVTGNTGDGIAIGGFRSFTQVSENRIISNVATGNGGSTNNSRYDLHDYSQGEGRSGPTCHNNVWQDNVFNTAFPLCATGGLGSVEGPPDDPTCTDGRDNDLDGAADGDDSDCVRPPVFEGPR